MTNQTSRRAFMSALPALAAAPTVAASQRPANDPHADWMDQWRAARDRWLELANMPGNGNWDDPRSVECEKIQTEMENRLRTVPATTIDGAIACLSWLEEEIGPNEWCSYIGHREALLNAIAALSALRDIGGEMK